MPITEATSADLASLEKQLGRTMRDVVGVGARCVCGNPIVVVTKPRLSDGSPFPTFYYLSLPAATAALSTLEAAGFMAKLQERLGEEPELAAAYLDAHAGYLADRLQHGIVPEIEGISAGGMPTRVKCLHALAGHALAAGPGVNPIGDLALEACAWKQSRCQCEQTL
ncbi:unannotated protein [freshwater metagenome]|uniref:Unannotated protein n=1 Tax=freshwater metagenome TaxID=449393 RepID=A0A6J6C158_9ZZZZ